METNKASDIFSISSDMALDTLSISLPTETIHNRDNNCNSNVIKHELDFYASLYANLRFKQKTKFTF